MHNGKYHAHVVMNIKGAYRRSGGRGDCGVQGVHVKAQVDGAVPVRVDVVKGHVDDAPDTILVYFVHGEGFDAVLLEDALLARVDVAQTNVDDAVRLEDGLDPAELWHGFTDAEKEGHGHTVDVS